MGDALAKATFALGCFLPVLAGGNSFFTLEAAPGLALFVPIALVTIVAALERPAHTLPTWQLGSLAVLGGWWVAAAVLRPAGPRAALESSGVALAAVLHAVLLWRPLDAAALRSLALGLVVGAAATALFAQYQYWIVYPRIAPLLAAQGRGLFTSVNANFYSGNCYAPFLAATILLGGGILLSNAAAGTRAFVAAALPLLAFTLLLTGSRSTVALAAGIVATHVLATRIRTTSRALGLAAGVALVAGIIAFFAVDWAELWRFGVQGRLAVWQGALRMIFANALLGVGLGGFAESFYAYRVTDYYTRYPHNLWLEVTAELGIVAGIALAVFLGTALAATIRTLRAPLGDEAGTIRVGAALAAWLLALHAMLDIDWHAPANPLLLLVLLAIAHNRESRAAA